MRENAMIHDTYNCNCIYNVNMKMHGYVNVDV